MSKKYNCTVRGKPMYRVRTRVGTALDGTPVYKSFYGDGKVDAERKRDEYLQQASSGMQTFGQLAEYYTYNIMVHERLSAGTIALYEGQYRNHIRQQSICLRSVAHVTREDIQEVVLRRPQALRYLTRLFKWLSLQGYCDNLASGIVTPKKKRPETPITVFTEQEVQSIINTENPHHTLFLLALSTGLREGELLALRYGDIHNGAVHVERQLQQVYTFEDGYRQFANIIKEPKSKASIRTVPIPQNVLAELNLKGAKNDYIFTTDNGTFIDKSNFRRVWKRHLEKANVPYKKFHACRATYCTLLCKNGVSLETASKLMGHSDITVTAKFYRLVSDVELSSAVEKINALF